MAVNKIVIIAVGMILAAVLFPAAYSGIAAQVTTTTVDTDTYTWPATVVVVYQTLLPILAIIGIALLFLGGLSAVRGRF